MNWLWLNIPLMAVFFLAMTGIPLWLVFKHPDRRRAPDQRRAPDRQRAADRPRQALADHAPPPATRLPVMAVGSYKPDRAG